LNFGITLPSPSLILLILYSKKIVLLGLTGANQVVDSTYDFSVVDSNSLLFVFKYAPEVAKELHISSELSFETAMLSHRESWMVCMI
jgi:hypothetical protein